MKRAAIFVYSVAAYGLLLAVFLYLIGFVGNLWVPKSIDVGAASGVGEALLVNVLLVALFGAQHSVMARPGFKRAITRWLPEAMERSTFVLLASYAAYRQVTPAFIPWRLGASADAGLGPAPRWDATR